MALKLKKNAIDLSRWVVYISFIYGHVIFDQILLTFSSIYSVNEQNLLISTKYKKYISTYTLTVNQETYCKYLTTMALFSCSLSDVETNVPGVRLSLVESLDLAVPVQLVKDDLMLDCFWTPEKKKFRSVPLDINLAAYCQPFTISSGVKLSLKLSPTKRSYVGITEKRLCLFDTLELVMLSTQCKKNWMLQKCYGFDEKLCFGSVPNRNFYVTVPRIAKQDWMINIVFDETKRGTLDLAVPVQLKRDARIINCYGIREERQFGSVRLNVNLVTYHRLFTVSLKVKLNVTEEAYAGIMENRLHTLDTLVSNIISLVQHIEHGVLQLQERYSRFGSASNLINYETVPRIAEQNWIDVVFDEIARDTLDLAVPVQHKVDERAIDFFEKLVQWQLRSVRLNSDLITYYRSSRMLLRVELNPTKSSYVGVVENRLHILDTLGVGLPLVQHGKMGMLQGFRGLGDKLWFKSAPNRNNYVIIDETICNALDLAVPVLQKKDPMIMNYFELRKKQRFRSIPLEINLAVYCPAFVSLSEFNLELYRLRTVFAQFEKTAVRTMENTKLLPETADVACQTLMELFEETSFAHRNDIAMNPSNDHYSQRSVQTHTVQRRRSLWKRSTMAVGQFTANLRRHVCFCT